MGPKVPGGVFSMNFTVPIILNGAKRAEQFCYEFNILKKFEIFTHENQNLNRCVDFFEFMQKADALLVIF